LKEIGMQRETRPGGVPWWKHGGVWLLMAGPAAVVVAGFATLAIAMASADAVVHDAARPARIEQQHAAERSQLPALQARNHAATPAQP
jgi:hypothetical protein